jgi:hypothetical protein
MEKMKLVVVTGRYTNSPLYLDIAYDNYYKYRSYKQQIGMDEYRAKLNLTAREVKEIVRWLDTGTQHYFSKAPKGKNFRLAEGSDNLRNAVLELESYWIHTIVFAAFCLEAFIYDYAAENFSDRFAQRYLDTLDLRSKWVIIPQLVTGREFPRETQPFQHLIELIKERNNLVHFKSKAMKDYPGFNINSPKKDDKELNPYETVIEVLTLLKNIDSETIKNDWWKLVEDRE